MSADRAVLVGWTVCPMCGVRVCIHVFVRGVPCELCAPRAARDPARPYVSPCRVGLVDTAGTSARIGGVPGVL